MAILLTGDALLRWLKVSCEGEGCGFGPFCTFKWLFLGKVLLAKPGRQNGAQSWSGVSSTLLYVSFACAYVCEFAGGFSQVFPIAGGGEGGASTLERRRRRRRRPASRPAASRSLRWAELHTVIEPLPAADKPECPEQQCTLHASHHLRARCRALKIFDFPKRPS